MARRLLAPLLLCAACADPERVASPSDLGVEMATEMKGDMTADMAAGAPPLAPRGRAGRWFAADLHVHATGASNDTGGDSDPASIRRVAIERGLQVVLLTDHSNATGSDPSTRDEDPALFNMGPEFPLWEQARALSDDAFLMIDGNELSPVSPGERGPTGHIGCAPRDLTSFDHTGIVFTDRPRGAVSGADMIAQARAAGCFATLNHPFGPSSWVSFDWTSRGYDAMEVWNGGAGFDASDRDAVNAWMCDLALGKRTVAVGGSDNHRVHQENPGTLLNPPIGLPITWIWAEALRWDALMPHLEAGRVNITDTGAPLEVDVYAADGAWLGMAGDEIATDEARWMRVAGALPATLPNTYPAGERTLRVLHIAPGACEDLRAVGQRTAPQVAQRVVHEAAISPDGAFALTIPLDPQPGAYIVSMPAARTGATPSGGAISNAIFLTPAP